MKNRTKKLLKQFRSEPLPGRDKLGGYSRSEFKTLLRRHGFKVHRDFFGVGSCIATRRNRMYRFRFWGSYYPEDPTFLIDISCVKSEFDRWANSTDRTVTFEDWLKMFESDLTPKLRK